MPLSNHHNYHKDPATEEVGNPEAGLENGENNAINDPAGNDENPQPGPEIQVQVVNLKHEEISANLLEIMEEIVVSTNTNDTLQRYREVIRRQEEEIEALKGEISAVRPKVDSMSKIFNPDQQYKLLHPETTAKWSELTIENCLTYYYQISTSGYNFLIKRGYPLVSIRVLQRYMKKIISGPGIQYHLLKVLAKKVESMPPKARYCTLVVDEMEIKAKREYGGIISYENQLDFIPAYSRLYDYIE